MAYDRGNYRDKWRIERHATSVRSRLGLDQFTVLDPLLLAENLRAKVYTLADLIRDPGTLGRARLVAFDGFAFTDPSIRLSGIVLNCGRPATRRTATLMEELSHLEPQPGVREPGTPRAGHPSNEHAPRHRTNDAVASRWQVCPWA